MTRKKKVKSNLVWDILFFALIGITLVFRLLLSPYGNHIDLIINTGWGHWIYENGTTGFYTNNIWIYGWPTQLPLINLIYVYNFVIYEKILWCIAYFSEVIRVRNIFPNYFGWLFDLRRWFGTDLYAQTPYNNGIIVSMKVIPIVFDIVIASLIYTFGRRINSIKKALIISALYLSFPFSWYLSALWGQYDQVAAVLVVFSFFLLGIRKNKIFYFMFSPALFVLALQIKPSGLFVVPLYLFIYLFQKPKIKTVLIASVLAFLAAWLTFKPFLSGNVFEYTTQNILPVVFNNDRYGLVNRAFNFWQFLAPFGGWSTTFKVLGIKALYLGLFFWLLLTAVAVKVYVRKKNMAGILTSLFIVAGGSYQLMTGMVDRYFFTAVVTLAFLVLYKRNLLVWWILLIILFSFNLFYSWGFPVLENFGSWKNMYIIRFFSFSELMIYLLTLVLCLK